jgi:hypothetical protein
MMAENGDDRCCPAATRVEITSGESAASDRVCAA